MRATLVHNPGAGDAGHGSDDILAVLADAGITARVIDSGAADLARVLADPGDLIVVGGGDGTVASVLTGLRRRDVPIAIVPLGTANNIARSLGIAGDIDALAAGWRMARRHAFRIGVADGPWGRRRFVEGLGFGCVAEVLAEKDSEGAPAQERYRRSASRLRAVLAAAHPVDLRLEADGREVEGALLVAEVLNIASVGPNLCFAPGADPADPCLDVVTVTTAERAALLAWLARDTRSTPPVRRLRARRLRAEWRGVLLHLDDEFPEAPSGACEITLEDEPIVILVPRPSP